jgi:hypothetical protein
MDPGTLLPGFCILPSDSILHFLFKHNIMKIRYFLLISLLCVFYRVNSQVVNPASFLGYEIGDKFTYSHTVEAYFKKLSEVSDRVKMEYYGTSYEGRPLYVVYLSEPQHLNRLEEIRSSNMTKAGLEEGQKIDDQPVIVWLSYNIHGNEAVSTETAMLTAYELLSVPEYSEWLKHSIVVIDPCLNPDGHTRYVQFYTERVGFRPNVTPMTREHLEPWPGGRPNHYLFDLNRDWAWQTQQETKHRIALYNKWLPQVHVDFHEMGINSPYYFAPSAEPIHSDITPWQRDFQVKVGKHLGSEFDKRNWLYFAGEIFDLFYPSYGDTYPSFNGSVGMTYEQGGSGRAGLAVITAEGDTLTLRNRIDHHHIAGLHTIEVSIIHKNSLLDNFEKYFSDSKNKSVAAYKTIVIKHDNTDKILSLAEFLDRNGIQYGFGSNNKATLNAWSHLNRKSSTITIDPEDMIISMYQPKSVLVKVLFDQETTLPDSNTYDITAWSLPYARGLNAFTLDAALQPVNKNLRPKEINRPLKKPVAYAVKWKSLDDAKFLSAIWQKGINPRIAHKPIKIEDHTLDRGTLIFTRNHYEAMGEKFDDQIVETASLYNRTLIPLYTSYPEDGPSFGSGYVSRITPPNIGLIAGQGTASYNVGELWYFLEQELGFPVHIYEVNTLSPNVLNDLDVLILPSTGWGGNVYSESFIKQLKTWLQKGGTAIAVEGAVSVLASSGEFGITMKAIPKKEDEEETAPVIENYSDRYRKSISTQNPGSIFSVDLDPTHPVAYGYENWYFNLKTNNNIYAPMQSGWNIGISGKMPLVSGFVGSKLQEKMEDYLVIGTEQIGSGKVIYFCDNPMFRSFWENGKLLMANALFMTREK